MIIDFDKWKLDRSMSRAESYANAQLDRMSDEEILKESLCDDLDKARQDVFHKYVDEYYSL